MNEIVIYLCQLLLQVAQMTKSELDNLDSTFFVPLAFALNRWFVGVFSETLILWTGLVSLQLLLCLFV